MMVQYGSEMGTYGARRPKRSTLRRPLIIGALAAGVIALGASTAVAADPLGSPSPGPVAMWGQGTSTGMMDGASMGTMHRTNTGMMDGASMGTMHR